MSESLERIESMRHNGKLYRDHALVLRVYKLGEADRILSLLSKHHGVKRVVAKGVRRTRSRFGARLSMFNCVDVQLYQGRSLDIVSQVETLHSYSDDIAAEYSHYTAATTVTETAEKLAAITDSSETLYTLTHGALSVLATRHLPSRLILDAYLLRAMELSGWGVQLTACATCGRDGAHRAFSIPSGGCVCMQCRPAGSTSPAAETLELMSALIGGEWEYAVNSSEQHRREASGLIAAYVTWHLERSLRSLPFVEWQKIPSLAMERP